VTVGVRLGIGVLVAVAMGLGSGVLVGMTGVLELIAWFDCGEFSPGFKLEQAGVNVKRIRIINQ
jgi:hypothetical protein